jgi:methylated-DNA-[protein]-cysteine S-methyltransferase
MSSTDLWNVWDVYESPLGPLTLTASARGLAGLWFPGSGGPFNELDRRPEAFREATAQLDEYFAGERRSFELELDLWGSRFDQRVWQELQLIPFGETRTYTELAVAVGRPDIVRGVAGAVARTPLPIIVPCHRVVAADGSLTGYLGGLQRKQALLELEGGGVAWSARQLSLI